ncbi:MAG TPA: VTT domain-containing protein [Vitreimonas sp.]|uniref:YqaA family protein n=1 Tax=Vitreimonas sp. TaxID=3069702 RepID=UPI002D3F9AEB|nr:VTT domain-containing protein [Vitreimonas sp.]HYD89394.1 VTT domain-containing protein [Vitreimonas sp.]
MGLRDRLRAWTRGPWVYPTSALIGFLEASFVLVPMEPLLIPVMAGRRRGVWSIAALLVAGNLLAAALLYWLGALLAPATVEPLVAAIGAHEAYASALENIRQRGFLALLLVDLTPIPFQVAMAAAGAAQFAFPLFLVAVVVSRGVRYFALAGLVLLIGRRAERWIDEHQLEIFIWSAIIFAVIAAAMIWL